MGELFLAKHGELEGFELPVIIKRVRPQLVADADFITRFIDEAKLGARLHHANIAQVVEVGSVDGEYFIALEYIKGCDLRRLLRRLEACKERLPIDLCLFIARELLNGLAYAHRRTDSDGKPLELVHRDISPPNTMVSFDGEVKIIDFGLARTTNRSASTRPNVGLGKFGYMAPEQLVIGGVQDRRTDLYAVGVVLYELLTGDIPFAFENETDYLEIARMVTDGVVRPPSTRNPRIDPELDRILLKALARSKDDRYQHADEFRDDLQARLTTANPTFNHDRLAHYLRHLFAQEIAEQKQTMADLMAADVSQYREEPAEATARKTITFARAARPYAIASAPPLENEPPRPTSARLPQPVLVALAACVAMLTGALIVLVGLRIAPSALGTRPTPTLVRGAAPVATPPTTPLASSTPAPRAAPSTQLASTQLLRAPNEREAASVSRQQLSKKYLAVKAEYQSFKARHGAALRERWLAIARLAKAPKDRDRPRLNAMLESLRRTMRHER
jgi:serine/threonine protein kinase